MKIFAIYLNIDLTHKPEWLDEFRAKYDKPYEYHITLKQPVYIDESQVMDVRERVSVFVAGLQLPDHALTVAFDRVITDTKDSEDICIMIRAAENIPLIDLQRGLVEALAGYENYCKPESAGWEKEFMPHITIGRDLNLDSLEQAQKEMHPEDLPTGIITELVLAVVDDLNPIEANNPKNQTVYQL